jgi:hypothetical protein
MVNVYIRKSIFVLFEEGTTYGNRLVYIVSALVNVNFSEQTQIRREVHVTILVAP